MSRSKLTDTFDWSLPFNLDYLTEDQIYDAMLLDLIDYEIDGVTDNRISHLREQREKEIESLKEIERFVRAAFTTEGPVFVERNGGNGFSTKLSKVASYLSQVHPLFANLKIGSLYSPEVELFRGACQEMRDATNGIWFFGVPIEIERMIRNPKPGFNDFVDRIRRGAKEEKFKIARKRQREKFDRRMRTVVDHVRSLFNTRSKLLVLRVDFSYRQDIASQITVKEAKDDLARFLNNTRGNARLFSDMLGYGWKLEDGFEKGLHFHMIFFYNGQTVQADAHWAQRLGTYWRDKITKGRGLFFNCNKSKSSYKKLGIGMIESSDHEKIETLINRVCGYMAKTGLYFGRKGVLEGKRCFQMGEEPPRKSNAGRPRKSVNRASRPVDNAARRTGSANADEPRTRKA